MEVLPIAADGSIEESEVWSASSDFSELLLYPVKVFGDIAKCLRLNVSL